jgi:hypothetical protein
MKLICPNCGKNGEAPDDMTGKHVKCISCEKVFTIEAAKKNISGNVKSMNHFLNETIPLQEEIENADDLLKNNSNSKISRENYKKNIKSLPILYFVLFAIVLFLTSLISHSIGYSKGKKFKEDAVVMAALINANKDYQGTISSISANRNKIAKIEKYESRLSTLESGINSKQQQSLQLSRDISSKQSELDSLNGKVTKAKSKPIIIPAGEHTVGGYIKAGRYSAAARSEYGANFIVYSSSGELKVNTILGGDNGVDSYACNLEDGDVITAHARTYLYPWI